MTDIRTAEGNDGNAGFEAEFARLARQERGQSDEDRQEDQSPRDGEAEKPEDSGQADEEPTPHRPDAEGPAGSETDDIWASADPRLKAAFEAEKVRAAKAENVIRSNNGRLSAAQRELAELRARPVPQEPRRPEVSREAKRVADEDLKRFEEEYPDIAQPLLQVISDLRSKVDNLSNANSSQAQRQAARDELEAHEFLAKQEQALSGVHPDWNEKVLTQEFADWVLSQPRYTQEAIRRNGNGIVDGAEAIDILDRFKAAASINKGSDPLAEKRQRQLEGSRSIPSRAPTAPGSGKGGGIEDEWARLRDQDRRQQTAHAR